jgi:hypothetical protein
MSHPLADPRTLLTLVRIDLAAHPPGDAVEGVTVAAQPSPRRLTQFSLFDPALPSPEKLAVTLARLTHLVGPGRVGAPAVRDTHRPGAFGMEVFQVATGASACPSPNGEATPLPQLKNSELRYKALNGNNGARRARQALLASPSPAAVEEPERHQHTITTSLPESSFPAIDTRATSSVLVFPELETCPVEEQSRTSRGLPRPGNNGVGLIGDRRSLLAKVVVFPSPFHGEGQAGAPVPTANVARLASLGSLAAPVLSTNGSTDQRIHRSTSHDGSTDQQINRSTAHHRSTAHAFRCFRPSAEAEVLLRGRVPVYIDSFEVRGPACARAGPWRVCGEWWSEEWHYEEWDVEVNGRLYRICCELPARRWYVTGAYD